ncbi:MAG: ABC transporter permease [Chitinophagales bacterium]|nr:ABC transporter permease [Chitinophagales bacterium]
MAKNKSVQIISAQPETILDYIKKVWNARLLIVSFSKRDIQTKYAQTLLGIAWTLLQPITGIIIFTFFFQYILKIKLEEAPYPVFALIGFTAWNLWSSTFQQGSLSIFEQRGLLSKVYFPKIILPLSKALTGTFDFIIALTLLIILIPFYKIHVSWRLIIIPLFYLIQIIFSVSFAIILAVSSVKRRDLFHFVPYILNFGIWASPVFYAITLFPEKWQFIFNYNPIALCIEGYRWCIFNNYPFRIELLYSLPIVFTFSIIALVMMKKNDDHFTDHI